MLCIRLLRSLVGRVELASLRIREEYPEFRQD